MALLDLSALKKQLEEQLYFIEKSIADFEINEVEAKRVATNIRILLHDTAKSTSLLMHLGEKNIQFYETASTKDSFSNFNMQGPFKAQVGLDYFIPNTPYAGLVAKDILNENGKIILKYKPLYKHHRLDIMQKYPLVDFDTWWNHEIYDNRKGYTLTRKQLILNVSNKDGGAHVDDEHDENYTAFKNDEMLVINVNGQIQGFQNIPVFSSVIQIAWETLTSIKKQVAT